MSYGFKTVIELDGQTMDVTACSYSFSREVNELGDVTSKPLGGIIFLSLSDIPNDNILAWGIEHRKWKSGLIKVIGNDGMQVQAEEISFDNAACINIKLSYERDSSDYFTTLLTISAENIKVGSYSSWINKDWKF